jgi:hypothetical protein
MTRRFMICLVGLPHRADGGDPPDDDPLGSAHPLGQRRRGLLCGKEAVVQARTEEEETHSSRNEA